MGRLNTSEGQEANVMYTHEVLFYCYFLTGRCEQWMDGAWQNRV
jgi:hypothetical protein